jgi:hypothetical protein
MFESIKSFIANYQKNKRLKELRKNHIDKVRIIELHKNLIKYRPNLEKIAVDLNDIIYPTFEKKGSIERQFIVVMAIRLRDLFESTLLVIGTRYYYSMFTLIRSLIESYILLQYIKINPHYMKEIMENENSRGKKLAHIRQVVKAIDKGTDDLYDAFSTVVHVNPASFKLTRYEMEHRVTKVKAYMITEIPMEVEKDFNTFTLTIINLMNRSITILKELDSQIDSAP